MPYGARKQWTNKRDKHKGEGSKELHQLRQGQSQTNITMVEFLIHGCCYSTITICYKLISLNWMCAMLCAMNLMHYALRIDVLCATERRVREYLTATSYGTVAVGSGDRTF